MVVFCGITLFSTNYLTIQRLKATQHSLHIIEVSVVLLLTLPIWKRSLPFQKVGWIKDIEMK